MNRVARVMMATALAGFGLFGLSPAAKAECPDVELPYKNGEAPSPADYGFIYTDANGATRVNPANGPEWLVAFASFYGTGNAQALACNAGPVTSCVLGAVGALNPTEYVRVEGGELVIDRPQLDSDLDNLLASCPTIAVRP